jgi:alpha-N-arabinofuranosidase
VTVLDAAATLDPESGAVSVFCLNRSVDEPLRVDLSVSGTDIRVVEHLAMGDDRRVNTQQEPEAVVPRPVKVPDGQGASMSVELPPASWSLVRLESVPA